MPKLAFRLLLLISMGTVMLLLSCGSTVMPAAPSSGSGSGVGQGGSGSNGGSTPTSITGHLAVADGGDNRILIYGTPLSANESASIVIGQTTFTEGAANEGNANPSAATLDNPWGLATDSSGDLWVADNQNCRVLEFQPPFRNGMSASLVIGEPDFATTGPRSASYCDLDPSSPLDSTYMGEPDSIAFDSQGDLWVVESSVGRIAEYVPPFSDGMAPSLVVGQTNLQGSAPCNGAANGNHGPILSPTAATLCTPTAITFDSQGDLWVADAGNVRILEFVPPFSTGMSASLEMVGQPPMNFYDNGTSCANTSANNFCTLAALKFDRNDDLWVADSTFERVLEFTPPYSSGMAASLVIGQPNLNDTGPSRSSYLNPIGLTFDANGGLIITNGRPYYSQILVYAPPFNSGMSAKTVSGLMNCPPSDGLAANTLCGPSGIVALK